METTWRGHTLRVTGNWVARYLFLAPQYELWLDDVRLDASGGPRIRPRLEAIIEDPGEETAADSEPTRYHVEAHIFSIAGVRPRCEICIDGTPVHSDRVRVDNLLNPFLLLFIMVTTSWMLYVGPDILRAYLARL